MTHTTEDWHYSPLPEGVSHAITVPPGRGGGRSGGPSGQTWTGTQDGDLQSGTDNGGHGGAGSSWGHGGAGSSGGQDGAGSSGGHGRWSLWPWPRSPRSGPYSRNPFYPPKKKFPGEVRSPPGLDRRTGQPTGTESPPGRARKLRLLLGMTRHQGPSQGSLSYRFHDREAGGWNGLRGHNKRSRLPQTSLHGQDKTR